MPCAFIRQPNVRAIPQSGAIHESVCVGAAPKSRHDPPYTKLTVTRTFAQSSIPR